MSFFSVDLSPFLIKIWDATAGELKHLRRPKPRIEGLKDAITELSAKEGDINNKIMLAELEREIPTNQVQQWLREVEELKGKAAATEQDFESWRCLCGWSWNCFSVNRRVAKRMKKIDILMTRSDATPVSMKPPPSAVVEIPVSDPTVGMEKYESEILDYIASANTVEIIGIYGMGGAGKTTLLKSINNHKDISTKFDHVIWAVASKECKMEKLQMDIAKWLGIHLKQDDSTDRHAAELYGFLKNKDCLLLLDDLWKPVDLAMLGMVNTSQAQEKRKRMVVVFTTRFVQVCGDMNTSREMQIKCLKPEEAWLLFQSKANDAIGSDPGIKHIARQIAEECAGLPLALITVGMALSRKKWEAWKYALKLMKHSQIPQVTGKKEEDPMFSAFKLSYDMLQDDEMRGCLLSCALWPEDHSINKEELIEYWMGLGLINEEGAIHEAYDMGLSHIETLKAACLLEPGNDEEREVKMHDVTRDMALWMASDCGEKIFKWIVRAGVGVSRELEEKGWHEAARASLMYNDIASLPKQLSTCSKLSVLMLQGSEKLKEIRGTLIQAMPSLTYLDLSNTGIAEIPKEISMLSQLQYLNLSNTQIREVPAELGNLVNLKYLFLRNIWSLTAVAKGAIANLSLLRLLDLRGSRLVLWSVCWDELEGLKGCPKSSIGIEIREATTLQRLYSLQHVSIWRLDVSAFYEDSANLNQLLDNIMKSPNTRSIEQLKIYNLRMKELLISKGNEEAGRLECLKYLYLSRLFQLEEIMWKEVLPQIVFPNLRELRINWCEKLKNVNWVLQLPSLTVLDISDCYEMVELISDEGSVGLRRIRLFDMRKLERISWRTLYFPNLEKIEVQNCPLLKKLPSFGNRLKEIKCKQGWWDNLEWEDVSIKNSLSPLVGRSKYDAWGLEGIGMEEYKREILGYIAGPNAFEVIGICGMVGIGKTTLLKSINNHRDISTKFHHVIWAVGSKECTMERLQKDIAKWLGIHLKQDDSTDRHADELYDFLKNKDCLLLLDDLWKPVDLAMLGMVNASSWHGEPKRKVVVFTTRYARVCRGMNTSREKQIKCLQKEEAWELLRSKASGPIGSDPGIEHKAHQIAEECAGLPLALVTVGAAMSRNNLWEDWSDALTLMKHSQMPQITGENEKEDPMFSAFKLSYDMLRNDEMRGCLLSCALWPEDHSINKEEIIECWMGLGLINQEGEIHKTYNKGYSHIETLKAACLLEPGNDEETEVKVHDVIRDKALWMANDSGKKKFKWMVSAGGAARRALEEERWHEAERVSLMYNDITSLPNQLSTCSKLSVLMLQGNRELKEIRGTLVQAMPSLTYLDLNNTGIEEIPKEITTLSQLQHLNLSNTQIRELPAELGNLVNLKYLFLRYTRFLTTVAKGAISNLALLRLLDLRQSRLVDCNVCWDELEGLKGRPKSSIGIEITTEATLQRLYSLQHVSIWRLCVNIRDDSINLNQFLDNIMKSPNTRSMEQLEICHLQIKELLISKGSEEAGRLECLKYLCLLDLLQLEEITWRGVLPQIVFPYLCELRIDFCRRLKNVNWVLQLPSLIVLDISYCDEMVELISDEGSVGLRRMKLFRMEKLERISWRPLYFPNLEKIEVLGCPLLKELQFFGNNLEKIEVRDCPLLKKLSSFGNRLKVIQCNEKW